MTSNFIHRPSRENIIRYSGGRLGIAAVPGAEKTHILSVLAAQIIQSGAFVDDTETLLKPHARGWIIKERLHLFYAGITRAKRDLIVTWNSGRQGDATLSLPLSELMG